MVKARKTRRYRRKFPRYKIPKNNQTYITLDAYSAIQWDDSSKYLGFKPGGQYYRFRTLRDFLSLSTHNNSWTKVSAMWGFFKVHAIQMKIVTNFTVLGSNTAPDSVYAVGFSPNTINSQTFADIVSLDHKILANAYSPVPVQHYFNVTNYFENKWYSMLDGFPTTIGFFFVQHAGSVFNTNFNAYFFIKVYLSVKDPKV